jgi:hypothetical protein
MRYQEIERTERKCSLCTEEEVGDEWHYLTQCKNNEISDLRCDFVKKIKCIQTQLNDFNLVNLMKYTMHDTVTQTQTAYFVKALLKTYSAAKDE